MATGSATDVVSTSDRLIMAIALAPLGKVVATLGLASSVTIAATIGVHLPGPVPAKVMDVIDGDSLRVRALIWVGQELETVVRVSGVDAPELRGKCASEREAAARARELLRQLTEGGVVRLRDVRFDKYGGRVLASVESPRGEDVAKRMLDQGVVRRYDGARRADWC
jgi:micrococcal nuclease